MEENRVYANQDNKKEGVDILSPWEKIDHYKETKEILSVKISGIVNKGVIALVEGVRGFIPVGKLDIKPVKELNEWLGKEVRVRVVTADREKGKLVLSAYEILKEESLQEKKEQKARAISQITVGSVLEGKVNSLQPYGAFIDLGNDIQGLVHISRISLHRINSPQEVLEPGQTVRVKVIKNEGGKISLSIRDVLREERLKEEEEIKKSLPKPENIGTSLGTLLQGIKVDQ